MDFLPFSFSAAQSVAQWWMETSFFSREFKLITTSKYIRIVAAHDRHFQVVIITLKRWAFSFFSVKLGTLLSWNGWRLCRWFWNPPLKTFTAKSKRGEKEKANIFPHDRTSMRKMGFGCQLELPTHSRLSTNDYFSVFLNSSFSCPRTHSVDGRRVEFLCLFIAEFSLFRSFPIYSPPVDRNLLSSMKFFLLLSSYFLTHQLNYTIVCGSFFYASRSFRVNFLTVGRREIPWIFLLPLYITHTFSLNSAWSFWSFSQLLMFHFLGRLFIHSVRQLSSRCRPKQLAGLFCLSEHINICCYSSDSRNV